MNNSDIPVFYLEDFSFKYPFSNKQIYFNGSLSIQPGECILIKGASGSGKSTLLMALKGLIPHLINGKLDGTLLFHGQNISKLDARHSLKIGYLQQNPDNQLICHTVLDELAFGLENTGLAKIEIIRKIEEITARFDVSHLVNRNPATLSGGQKQTVNLLAILLLEPEVLLLDEPTAFLDPESAHKIMGIISEYTRNKVVIIIEHNHHYLNKLVTRIINIDGKGNIIEEPIKDAMWQQSLPKLVPSINNNTSPLLTISNLSFSYPNSTAILNSIDLKINKGEVIGLIGGNGNGKSTLLQLIAGILPSHNQIFIDNIAINKIPKQQLWQKISILWQNPEAHFIHTKVCQELNNDLELAELLNLENHQDSSPFSLSEGQKRRLSIGIVIQHTPQLLLLDEPTFGQDYDNKLTLAKLINKIANNGTAILIVSHDLEFISCISNKTYQLGQKALSLWQK